MKYREKIIISKRDERTVLPYFCFSKVIISVLFSILVVHFLFFVRYRIHVVIFTTTFLHPKWIEMQRITDNALDDSIVAGLTQLVLRENLDGFEDLHRLFGIKRALFRKYISAR